MTTLLRRLLSIGADPGDDEDTRLRKLLLVVAALVTTPLAVVWGAVYLAGGAPVAAAIPWLYVAVSGLSLVAFARTRRYGWFAVGQFAPYVTLPFVLMWVLGGFVSGSAVAIWAGLAPIIAVLLGHRAAALGLAGGFSLLMFVSAFVPPPAEPALDDRLRQVLFLLNLTAVPLLAWLLVMRGLVRRYFPADLAQALSADPSRTDLGGGTASVTVLFADLGGFTAYAEHRAPSEVVDLLNRYFALALPAIIEEGGVPTQLAGDAVMAVFGAPTHQHDHAARACRAARSILARTETLSAGPEGGPRFHVGINTGQALVGNIGNEDYRNFTVIGDTTNLAARLQNVAKPGEIVIGPGTAASLDGTFALTSMGPIQVKGRQRAIEVFRLAQEDPGRVGGSRPS
jgi:class 3 adenylate cyclase